MRYCLLLFLVLFSFSTDAQEPAYKGMLGKYRIEMILNSADGENYTGRYRYEGKKDWIALKGKTKQLIAYINEYVDDKQTGMFVLNFEEDQIIGTWQKTKADKPLAVKLRFTESDDALTGDYKMIGDVDDSKFPKEHKKERPVGELQIKQLGTYKISFWLDYNSGYPEYHIAQITGEAVSGDYGKTYVLDDHIDGFGEESDRCTILIIPQNGNIYLEGGDGIGCGAGANAHPEGLYKKR